MESYDAICAKVTESCDCVELVTVFHTWKEIRDALLSEAQLPFDTLWAGSWLFLAVGVYEVWSSRGSNSFWMPYFCWRCFLMSRFTG